MLYAHSPWDVLSQGDVLSDMEITETLGARSRTYSYTVIVLSHGCEIDKREANVAICARVKPVSGERSARYAEALRDGNVAHAMYLPESSTLPESYVDFRGIYRVALDDARRAIAEGRRCLSLSEAGQLALQGFVYRFFARVRLEDLLTPPPQPSMSAVEHVLEAARLLLARIDPRRLF